MNFSTNLSEIFFILRRPEQDVLTTSVHMKYPLFLSDFNQIFEKKNSNITLHEIRPVRTELFHADGKTDRQTDINTLIVVFCSFVNAPENRIKIPN
jgi:hypothetical protein